jgi:hypothetical protein
MHGSPGTTKAAEPGQESFGEEPGLPVLARIAAFLARLF